MSASWKCSACELVNNCSFKHCQACFTVCPVISTENNKQLLVSGFVRKYYGSFIPRAIIGLVELWVWVSDTFNQSDSDTGLIFQSFPYNKSMIYETVRRPSVSDWIDYKTAIGTDIIGRGEKQVWKFQILQGCPVPTVVVGIIGDEFVKSVNKKKIIGRFYHENSGYGISLYTSKLFHNAEWENNIIFPYAYQFDIKNNDTFSMILDLTKEKGILSYVIDSEKKNNEDDEHSNVAFDNIDVEQRYRCAVALYYRRRTTDRGVIDIVALLPVI